MPRAQQALVIAEAERLPEVLSQALNTKALIIRGEHPSEARALMREALQVALDHDLVQTALRAYNNLAVSELEADRREEARRVAAEGFELARQRGHRHYAINFSGWEVAFRLMEGRWDEAFALADEFFPEQPTAQALIANAHNWLAKACLDRDDQVAAAGHLALVAPEVLESTDVQLRSTALMHTTLLAIRDGRAEDAMRSCEAWIANELEQVAAQSAVSALSCADDVALDYGLYSRLQELVARFDGVPELQRTRAVVGELGRARGIIAAHTGDEHAAIDAFGAGLAAARNANDVWLTAQILTDYGRTLLSFGRADEAEPLLSEAEELWRRMGAKRWLERVAALHPKVEVAT
jgi:tetratricopeptide (TPR) repeat protein